MKITDLKGQMHVFTLTDKSTLRVPARKSVTINDNLVSKEIKTAEEMGLVRLTSERNGSFTPPRAKTKDTNVNKTESADQSGKDGDA